MTPGIHCDFSLAHPAVNGGAPVGFFLAADARGRKSLATHRARAGHPASLATGGTAYADFGPGAREWRLLVALRPHGVDYRQGVARGGTLAELRAFYALPGAALTLALPGGETHPAWLLALEERTHPPDPVAEAELTLMEAL